MNKFVKVFDKKTADTLTENGFTLISAANNVYIFLNDGNHKLAFETKRIVYTDKLDI